MTTEGTFVPRRKGMKDFKDSCQDNFRNLRVIIDMNQDWEQQEWRTTKKSHVDVSRMIDMKYE